MKEFFWYDLMTTDVAGAERFYGAVLGWTFGDPGMGDMPYRVISADGLGIGGIMNLPPENGGQKQPPGWIGYINVSDVDAEAERVLKADGRVHRAPDDIPGVGRFAVAADPGGAVFFLFKPSSTESRPEASPTAIGRIGWHELHAENRERDLAFYEQLFGWKKTDAIPLEDGGIYQLFSMGGETTGGVMTKMQQDPGPPRWLFYFTVDAIDAAAARVAENGGKIMMGPHEVPGGSFILHAMDPQGAWFCITAAKR